MHDPGNSTPDEFRPTPPLSDCWFLTGPTASGKTLVALELARRLDVEVVSLDSMAIYRGMDIGTAKPSLEQRNRVPHHLIDIRNPDEEFSLSEFVDGAHVAVRAIRARGREPLIVGGTPLYLKTLLRGVYQGPPADWEFRTMVEEEVARVGIQALHDRLNQVDPLTAARLHPHDKRRIIRALEVYKITGEPLSHQQTQFEEGRSAAECRAFVLGWPRPVLHTRIDERVERMFHGGLVGEVQDLVVRFGALSRTASQAVGYREVLEHLRQDGALKETIARVKARTRQFARRQETWFRSLEECRWIGRRTDDDPAEIADRICAMAR